MRSCPFQKLHTQRFGYTAAQDDDFQREEKEDAPSRNGVRRADGVKSYAPSYALITPAL
jgi:hypothetical protein